MVNINRGLINEALNLPNDDEPDVQGYDFQATLERPSVVQDEPALMTMGWPPIPAPDKDPRLCRPGVATITLKRPFTVDELAIARGWLGQAAQHSDHFTRIRIEADRIIVPGVAASEPDAPPLLAAYKLAEVMAERLGAITDRDLSNREVEILSDPADMTLHAMRELNTALSAFVRPTLRDEALEEAVAELIVRVEQLALLLGFTGVTHPLESIRIAETVVAFIDATRGAPPAA